MARREIQGSSILRWPRSRKALVILLIATSLVAFPVFQIANAAVGYLDGSATLRFYGLPSREALNLDPETRLFSTPLGCVVPMGGFLSQELHNSALRALISVFGPMKGSYLGPYPSEADAFGLIGSAKDEVRLADLPHAARAVFSHSTLGFLLGALYRYELHLDLVSRVWNRKKGLWPKVSKDSGSLEQLEQVILTTIVERNCITKTAGPPDWVVSLEFDGWRQPIRVYQTRRRSDAYSKLEHLAHVLQVPMVESFKLGGTVPVNPPDRVTHPKPQKTSSHAEAPGPDSGS